jgi:mannan endo-1,4-beta-mannosidase
MRSRLVLVLAVAIAVLAVAVTITRLRSSPRQAAAPAHLSLPPRPASYLGVYAAGGPSGYAPITKFAQTAGRQPNIAGYFSGWAEPFATPFAQAARDHGAATIVQIDPTYASIAAIAAGNYDSYLRTFADSVRNFGHPVIIGFGHEMNANWYSWGYTHVPPKTFVAAWRHMVRVFRGQGANNVTWLWTINQDRSNTGPIASWWPGSSYVTWVGIDGYYYRRGDTFARVFGRTIDQVRTFTSKPVLLSETAVGPAAGQPVKISDLFQGMRRYRTLGLVWFDITQHDGIYHQDWRLEDSKTGQAAFRSGVSSLALAHP